MTEPLHIEDTTVQELSYILFPKHKHTKLAKSAVEHFIDQYHRFGDARVDMTTLRNFIDYLIKEKGYN